MTNKSYDPIVRTYLLELPRPSTSDNRSDERRLRETLLAVSGLKQVDIPLTICRELPTLLRIAHYLIRAVVLNVDDSWEVVTIDDRRDMPPCYGVAVDLGSMGKVTKISSSKTFYEIINNSG